MCRKVNMGVLREQNMVKVHERTLGLLFNHNNRVTPAPSPAAKMEPVKPSPVGVMYKQLSLLPGQSALPSSCFSCLRPSCQVVP